MSDVGEAVRKLKQRPEEELRHARKHHQRALKALRDGAYGALSDSTREQLLERFHTNLEALNKALTQSGEADRTGETESSQQSTFSSPVRRMLTWLW